MSEQTPSTAPVRSWQEERLRWAAIPGWGMSLMVHALFLFILSTQLQSCGGDLSGTAEGEFRSVGLVVKENQLPNPNDSDSVEQQDVTNPDATATELTEVPDSPPITPSLPELGTPILGPGSLSPPVGLTNPLNSAPRSVPNSVAQPSAFGKGDGAVHFLGAVDRGAKFVYVIDNSSSMGENNALDFAKEELKASLQGLKASQEFAIIFYNDGVSPLTLAGNNSDELTAGSAINVNRARRMLAKFQPRGGTSHMPALYAALKHNPDVIFFLTDAKDVTLTAADLQKIKQTNRGKARIHCVEFGKGNELKIDNFLKKLARQTGGTHSYRDITRLQPKDR